MKLESEVFSFLRDLKKHNDREWFLANKTRYESNKLVVEEFVHALISKLSAFEPEVGSLDPKKCIYRIYRDVRFSKDKSPYKTNMGAFLMPGGTKDSPKAGYYLHLEPGNSFIGGGAYMPPPNVLKLIREAIDYDGTGLTKILTAANFKRYYSGLEGDKLKTMPKGFQADHEHIDLLKFKSFTAIHQLTDQEVIAPDFLSNVIKAFTALKPLNDFLNKALEA